MKHIKRISIIGIALAILFYGGMKLYQHQITSTVSTQTQNAENCEELKEWIRKEGWEKEIGANSSCEDIDKWIHQKLQAIVSHMQGSSAGLGKVGRFKIGGVQFAIPREYLYYKGERDGEMDGLTLMLRYPDMGPLVNKSNERDKDRIEVRIEKVEECDGCLDNDRAQYLFSTTLSEYAKEGKSEHYIPQKISTDEITGLDYYKIGRLHLKDAFLKGDPWNPEFWITCSNSSIYNRCVRYFMLQRGVSIRLDFNRDNHLKNALDINQKILQKLQSFIIKS